MKLNHPYREFENLKGWRILEKALEELSENGDPKESTARPYIVGYLVKKLVSSRALRFNLANGARPSREVVSKIPQLKPFRKRIRTK